MLAREILEGIEIDACIRNGVGERHGPEPAESLAGFGVGRALEIANDGPRRSAQDQTTLDAIDRVGKGDRRVQGSSRSCRRLCGSRFGTVPGARFSSIAVMASAVRRALSTAAARDATVPEPVSPPRLTTTTSGNGQPATAAALRAGRNPLLFHVRGGVKIREDPRAYARQNFTAQVVA